MHKVYIVGGSDEYSNLFKLLGFEQVEEVSQADLVCFTGGSDVSPSLYGARTHTTTYASAARDELEGRIFDYCQVREIPRVGICRGGQFLNVMSGGEMYQDVSNHTRSHMVEDTRTGELVWCSSTHHQMMKPSDEGTIVAVSVEVDSWRTWFDKEKDKFVQDTSETGIEVVWYPKTKSLCFQPHPEFISHNYFSMKEYFKDLLEEFFGFELNNVVGMLKQEGTVS